MKQSTRLLYALCSVACGIFSCESNENEILSNELSNSIWYFEGQGCDIYFDFKESTFILTNPCFDNDGKMDLVYWQSGSYTVESNVLTLTTNQSCNPESINKPLKYNFLIDSEILSLQDDDELAEFVKVQSGPIIPEGVEYGFWDRDNGGVWVTTNSCGSPY